MLMYSNCSGLHYWVPSKIRHGRIGRNASEGGKITRDPTRIVGILTISSEKQDGGITDW